MNKFVCIIAFLLFQNELQHCVSVSVVITPTSVNISLGSTTGFTCNTTDEVSHIYFWVNGTEASNITGFNESTHHNGITRTMKVDALRDNNNTNISCKAVLQDGTVCISSNSTLMIQGILDGVGDLMATVIDGSNVSLTWALPYSLDNVPITGYNIITSDGINITVNTTYHILTSSDPDPCNITTASVGAINNVGTSQYNNVSFYYQKAPHEFFFNGNLTFKESQLMLNLYINVTFLCIGDEILSVAVDPNGNIINYTNITIYSQHQLVNEYLPVLPIEWDTFIVNITLINRAGKSNKTIKFGSLIDINSSVIDCSTISVSWERPSVSDGVNIHNYTLLIYDDISHKLVNRVSVNGSVTSYQFEDDDLFHHRYTYVIYGNNELGQGNYSNMTFSYQRVPKSAKDDTIFNMSQSINNSIFLYFMIPIVLECTGEAPENISIEITCDNSTMIYNQTYPVEYANHPMNITGNISVELTQHYQRCSLSIVFSNSAGHSEPVIFQVTIKSPHLMFLLTLVLVPIIFIIIILVSCLLICKFTHRCCFKKEVSISKEQTEDPDPLDYYRTTARQESEGNTLDQENQPKYRQAHTTTTNTEEKNNPTTSTTTDNPTTSITTDNTTTSITTDNPTTSTTATEENNNLTTTTEGELDYGVPPSTATSESLIDNSVYGISQPQSQYIDKISTNYSESDTASTGLDNVHKPLIKPTLKPKSK